MTGTTFDPVCSMHVEPEEAVAESEYQGQIYYFCCTEREASFSLTIRRITSTNELRTRNPDLKWARQLFRGCAHIPLQQMP